MVALSENVALAASPQVARRAPSPVGDRIFRGAALASALLVLLVLAGILASIAYGGWPAFRSSAPAS